MFSGQQKFVKNLVSKLHFIVWIMAEIEPYSFEPMRDSSGSEEDDVQESQDERQRGNTSWCVCVLRTGKGNKRKNVYAARRSRKP